MVPGHSSRWVLCKPGANGDKHKVKLLLSVCQVTFSQHWIIQGEYFPIFQLLYLLKSSDSRVIPEFEDLAHRLYLWECLFIPGRGNSKLWDQSLLGEFSVHFWLSTWVAECWIKAKEKEPEEHWCGCTLNLRKGIKALFSWTNHMIHTAAFQVLEWGTQAAGAGAAMVFPAGHWLWRLLTTAAVHPVM